MRHPVLGIVSFDLVLKSTKLISNISFENCDSFHGIGMNKQANFISRNLSLCAMNQDLYSCQLTEENDSTNSVKPFFNYTNIAFQI